MMGLALQGQGQLDMPPSTASVAVPVRMMR
jgi:hypothetical protein